MNNFNYDIYRLDFIPQVRKSYKNKIALGMSSG